TNRWISPLVAFTALAWGLSWVIWLPQIAEAKGWIEGPASIYFHLIGGIGPMVAGILVTWRWSGRAGLRRLARQSTAVRDWRWNTIGLLGPVVLFFVAVVITRIADGVWPNLSRFGASEEYATLGISLYWLANLVFYGFGEEIGWRGVLLPRLQAHMHALPATLIVALIWTLWHVPSFTFVPGYVAMDLAGFVGLFFSFLTGALIMTWIYNGSGGNLLALALFHASLDITINTPTGSDMLYTAYGAAITVAGIAVLLRYGWRNLAHAPRVTEPVVETKQPDAVFEVGFS
ncbi:MAG: CPBP family intramembrane metalloprotease, partial [Acidimicrobiia bacterium]|nr:CPBP family intramembrane metalloprotease [Acidimicrobiia bacterium]